LLLSQGCTDRRSDVSTAVDIPALGDDLGSLHLRDPELIEPGHNANDPEEPRVRVDEAGRVPEQADELEGAVEPITAPEP
jgi:hypothetical protein